MLFKKKPRREIIVLQLTALIDIFSMLIIFLIKGTVFGTTSIDIPKDVNLPVSHSKESLEAAPQVTVRQGQVSFSGISVVASGLENSEAEDIRRLAKLVSDRQNGDYLLNILADRDTPYSTIYSVVQFFRKAGFQSVLFVAIGEPQK